MHVSKNLAQFLTHSRYSKHRDRPLLLGEAAGMVLGSEEQAKTQISSFTVEQGGERDARDAGDSQGPGAGAHPCSGGKAMTDRDLP